MTEWFLGEFAVIEEPGSCLVWVMPGGSTSIMAVTAGFQTLTGMDPTFVAGKALHSLCTPSEALVVSGTPLIL